LLTEPISFDTVAHMKTADALRGARKSAGLTQRQIAEMLGITPQFVNDIEHGKRALGEKYLPLLPPVMRTIVATAMMDEHRAAITRIGDDLWNNLPETG
jgi:transcriptional regulator with XRE-family HTH domain